MHVAGQETVAMEEGDPPVYEWWFGDRPAEADCKEKELRGFWRRYHPTVCRRLERFWQAGSDFTECRAAADVDGVRYCIHRVTPEVPFDYRGREGTGASTFQEAMAISTAFPCFDELDRATGNCLVQFRKEDPNRRRPARRRMNPEEIAKNAARTGEPCCICFSEEGEVTGCAQLHVICGYCLRAGLRAMIGDITQLDKLLCGCFSHVSRGTVSALALRADGQLQVAVASPDLDAMERSFLEEELTGLRRQLELGAEDVLPSEVYTARVKDWYDKVIRQQIMPNYYVCKHPDCAEEVENWMLRETFDREYRAKGEFKWQCPLGHMNSVLPVEDEIRLVNKTVLLHPEYYVQSAAYDSCPLRRYRLCPGCVSGGVLLLAVHADGCKQWPGGGSAHRHCFCFACSRMWGSECGHGTRCQDPGIQQVRKTSDGLEIGFVQGQAYLQWLSGQQAHPPPTEFSTEPFLVDGEERQRELGMQDREALLAESQQGTQ